MLLVKTFVALVPSALLCSTGSIDMFLSINASEHSVYLPDLALQASTHAGLQCMSYVVHHTGILPK